MASNQHNFSLSQKLRIVCCLVTALFPVNAWSQPGGKAFQFLEMTNSARIAALGGDVVAVYDNDLDLAYHNPAQLTRELHHNMTLNFVNYFAGINYGYASAAANLGQKGMIGGGIHYLNYGKFQGADETGLLTGNFRAADYSVNIMYSRPLDSLIHFGFTVKSVFSDLEMYNSTAIAFDAGITYCNPGSKFAAGIVLRNIGFQVDAYYPEGAGEPLPFNIALGISQGLQHAPLSFILVASHLEKWDLTYTTREERENPTETLTGESASESDFDIFVDKFMRHIHIGTEFSIGNNLTLRAGFNYRRRQEMKISNNPGMVGFSWGIGVKIAKFHIGYGHGIYHLAGGTNQFSFGMNLDEFSRKF